MTCTVGAGAFPARPWAVGADTTCSLVTITRRSAPSPPGTSYTTPEPLPLACGVCTSTVTTDGNARRATLSTAQPLLSEPEFPHSVAHPTTATSPPPTRAPTSPATRAGSIPRRLQAAPSPVEAGSDARAGPVFAPPVAEPIVAPPGVPGGLTSADLASASRLPAVLRPG